MGFINVSSTDSASRIHFLIRVGTSTCFRSVRRATHVFCGIRTLSAAPIHVQMHPETAAESRKRIPQFLRCKVVFAGLMKLRGIRNSHELPQRVESNFVVVHGFCLVEINDKIINFVFQLTHNNVSWGDITVNESCFMDICTVLEAARRLRRLRSFEG